MWYCVFWLRHVYGCWFIHTCTLCIVFIRFGRLFWYWSYWYAAISRLRFSIPSVLSVECVGLERPSKCMNTPKFAIVGVSMMLSMLLFVLSFFVQFLQVQMRGSHNPSPTFACSAFRADESWTFTGHTTVSLSIALFDWKIHNNSSGP